LPAVTEAKTLFWKRKRDSERFKELGYPHLKFLYSMALRYAGNTYDAEDMVQETLYTAFKNFHQLRDESKCKPWLFTILRSIYVKEIRKRERIQQVENFEYIDYIRLLETAAEQFDTEKALEKRIEESRLRHILAKLPEKYKSPLLLHYMEDMSYQEISSYLEIPVGTVMSRLARGKEMLKKEIVRLLKKNSSMANVVEFRKTEKDG
jgi:RNA polymerase sigma-70 factor (ECF subfamily)